MPHMSSYVTAGFSSRGEGSAAAGVMKDAACLILMMKLIQRDEGRGDG